MSSEQSDNLITPFKSIWKAGYVWCPPKSFYTVTERVGSEVAMLCERFVTCAFFKTYKNDISTRQYEFLIATYCEGDLRPQCKRMKWRQNKKEEPPETLLPNGYLIGSTSRVYDWIFLRPTRMTTRYQVAFVMRINELFVRQLLQFDFFVAYKK